MGDSHQGGTEESDRAQESRQEEGAVSSCSSGRGLAPLRIRFVSSKLMSSVVECSYELFIDRRCRIAVDVVVVSCRLEYSRSMRSIADVRVVLDSRGKFSLRFPRVHVCMHECGINNTGI